MDEGTRAMIFALRNPPKGTKKVKLKDIRKLVKKKNNRRPTLQSISDAANTFKTPKMKRGRPLGSRATTKAEDRNILNTFKKVRPPGYGVVARQVHAALPKTVQKKIQKRTVIRRLAEKGCEGMWSECLFSLWPPRFTNVTLTKTLESWVQNGCQVFVDSPLVGSQWLPGVCCFRVVARCLCFRVVARSFVLRVQVRLNLLVRWTSYGGPCTVDILRWTLYVFSLIGLTYLIDCSSEAPPLQKNTHCLINTCNAWPMH